MITIYHNPKCAKSRETLKLLEERGVKPRIIEYLKTQPSQTELTRLLKMLGLTPGQLVRRKELEYKRAKLDKATDAEILRAMIAHPILIERPIVVADGKAALGRPPQNVLKIL